MKIRTGFVSNSSSSSFLITWPHEPKSAQDVYSMMFHKGEFPITEYDYGPYDPVEVAARVWSDLESQINKAPVSRATIMEAMENVAWSEDYREIDRHHQGGKWPDPYERGIAVEEREIRSAARDARVRERASHLTDEFIKTKGFICSLEYSDNDGPFDTVMEFGEVFRQVPHQRISHH